MFVDRLLVVAVFFAFAFVVGVFGEDNDALGGILFLCWLVGMWVYFAAFLAFAQGATPGKKLLKIKVTRTSGGGVSFGRATARFFGRFIPFGLFIALFNDRKQWVVLGKLGVRLNRSSANCVPCILQSA